MSEEKKEKKIVARTLKSSREQWNPQYAQQLHQAKMLMRLARGTSPAVSVRLSAAEKYLQAHPNEKFYILIPHVPMLAPPNYTEVKSPGTAVPIMFVGTPEELKQQLTTAFTLWKLDNEADFANFASMIGAPEEEELFHPDPDDPEVESIEIDYIPADVANYVEQNALAYSAPMFSQAARDTETKMYQYTQNAVPPLNTAYKHYLANAV